MILDNHRITIREVANNFGISLCSYQTIFTNVLGIKHAAAKIVPPVLNCEQTPRCVDNTEEMLTTFNDYSDLLKKVITRDESWLYCYDIEIRFTTTEEMNEKSKKKLLARPKSTSQKCLEDWKKRWHKYIISEGDYFEGNKIVTAVAVV